MSNARFTRRDALKLGAVAAAAAGTSSLLSKGARAQSAADRRWLFVVCAAGGASIVDSFLPVPASQGNGGAAFEDSLLSQPGGSNLRCVNVLDNSIEGVIALGNSYAQSTFLSKHKDDVAVMTHTGTSVNHLVAAKRALTGNNFNRGRTLQEAMSERYGGGLILPNCNMSGGGYLENGDDASVPDYARAEPVADPRLFPFATHGSRGVEGAPSSQLLERARRVRGELEDASGFMRTFRRSSLLERYRSRRDRLVPSLEQSDLITKLMTLQDRPGETPLSDYGLETSPEGQQLLEKFPKLLDDPYEAQGALAFLLARYDVACSITLAPGNSPVFETTERIINAPIAFDWSHRDHRGGQNAMWSRVLSVVDGLIDLLKATDVDGDPDNGKMWDKSLIYIATEFGRDKVASGGSGHHLNNGSVLISPLLRGNRVYGGVDPNTCLTYGFDPQTGEAQPGTEMTEPHLYSAVAHALGIEFEGRIDMPCMVRGA